MNTPRVLASLGPLILGAVFFPVPHLSAQDPALTLDQALQAAVQNRPLVNQAQAGLSAAQFRVAEARSSYLPSLHAQASWLHSIPQQEDQLGSLSMTTTPTEYWNFEVGADAPIYDFGRREAQVSLSRTGLQAAQVDLESVETSLIYQTAQSFTALVFLKRQLVAIDTQRANLQKHLDLVKARLDNGSGTKYDVINTQVRLTSLAGEKIDILRQQARQRWILGQLVGASDPGILDVRGDLENVAVPVVMSDLLDQSMARRQEIRSATIAVETAGLHKKTLELSWFPSLSASVNTGYKNPILTAQNTDLNIPQFNWALGLTLSFTGIDVPQVVEQIQEADAQRESSYQGLLAAKDQVRVEVATLYEDYQARRAMVDNARERLDESRHALEAAQFQFDTGAITNDSYLESELSFERAESDSLVTLYNEVASFYTLRQAAGESLKEAVN
jgi:outer membrane protein